MSGKEKSKAGSGLKELLKLYRFLKPYRWKFALVTEKTLASIRQHVYNHLIKLPMAFFAERRYSKKAQSYVAESNTIVEETLQGIQNVKAFTSVRTQMAIVMQDVFLFGGTIRKNIAYGKPDAGEQEIKDAAIQANAWDFIQTFPDKLNTVVGERGVQL